jgi:hypothetical protein
MYPILISSLDSENNYERDMVILKELAKEQGGRQDENVRRLDKKFVLLGEREKAQDGRLAENTRRLDNMVALLNNMWRHM